MKRKFIVFGFLLVFLGAIFFTEKAILASSIKDSHTITVRAGWNLLAEFDTFQLKKDAKYVVMFLPGLNRYTPFLDDPYNSEAEENEAKKILNDYKNLGISDSDLEKYLTPASLWFYFDKSKDGKQYTINTDSSSFAKYKLMKGWNFKGVTYSLVGNTINDFIGDCKISKMYAFNTENQSWVKLSLDYKFNEIELGFGLLLKAENNCQLGEPVQSVPSVPVLPN